MTTQHKLNLVSKFTGISDLKSCAHVLLIAESINSDFYWNDASIAEIKSVIVGAKRSADAMSKFTHEQLMTMCGMI